MPVIDKYFSKIAWILTSICFAAAGAMMLICGSFNLDRFYDVGEVYDVPEDILKWNGNSSLHYDTAEQHWVVDEETATKDISAFPGKWKYLYLVLSDVNEESFEAYINCHGKDGGIVGQIKTELREGSNLLAIPDVEYSMFYIVIKNQTGLSFNIEKVQFRENDKIISVTEFAKYFCILFAGFLFITGLIYKLGKKKSYGVSWYTLIHGLQTIFLYIGQQGEKFSLKYSGQKRSRMRSGLFCFVFLFMQIAFIQDLYFDKRSYRFLALIRVIILMQISFLCWEKPLRYLNWKNKFVLAWFELWLLAVISNFIVEKRFAYAGYSMIFVMGFLFFMWGNMTNREMLIRDFIRGIEWSFLPNLLFCWLFRPYIAGYRYSGATYSPGIFGLYLLFVWIAILSEIDFNITKKEVLLRDLLYIFLLGICGDLLWKTQSISSILPAALAAFIFSYKLWRNRKQVKIFGFLLYFIIFGIGCMGNRYGVYYLPRVIDSEVKFKGDYYQDTVTENPFMITIQAAEGNYSNRILYKIKTITSLETLTTGRTLFWKAYLREMNLWGHKGNAKFMGGAHMPHNGFLAIAYRYGIFAIVPYILLVLYNIWYAWRYFKRHLLEKKYTFFVLTNALCCTLLLFVENLELSFGWVCWYSMYIAMGIYFDDEKAVESDDKKHV